MEAMKTMMQTHSVHEAAHIYYDNAPPSERENIQAMFRGMDANNDGVISLDEFLSQFGEEIGEDDHDYPLKLFVLLDKNKNNLLEFNAFKTLYYFFKSRPVCRYCKRRLLYFYYCCVNCWETHIGNGNPQHKGGSEPFKLCLECYTKGSYKHQHSKFLDNYMLLQPMEKEPVEKSGDRDSLVRKSKESPMQSVFHAGHLYYQGLGYEAKNIADKLFEDMDGNGDGMVSVNEVILFLKKNGLEQSDAVKIFEYMGMSIQEDRNLTVKDAVAVSYTFFMRQYCRKCNTIIMGTYYSCVTCYNMSTARADSETWDLCADCYDRRQFWHEHETFLDNFVLFHMKNEPENIQRNQLLAEGSSSNPIGQYGVQVVQGSGSNLIVQNNVQVVQGSSSNPNLQQNVQAVKWSSSNPNVQHDVPVMRRRLRKILIKSVEIVAGASLGAALGPLCAIM